jgi:hypothetical protein
MSFQEVFRIFAYNSGKSARLSNKICAFRECSCSQRTPVKGSILDFSLINSNDISSFNMGVRGDINVILI